jgi:hypothetical protein
MKSILPIKDTTPSLSFKIGKMRNLLTILIASFILFTLSSCKDCSKKETKPDGRNGKVSDTKTPSSTIGDGGTTDSGKETKPDGRNGKVSDTKTPSSTTGDGGTTDSGRGSVSATGSGGGLIDKIDLHGDSGSGGGLASAKVLDGGLDLGGSGLPSLATGTVVKTKSDGSSLPSLTPAKLEAAARAKIKEVLEGYIGGIEGDPENIAPETINAFTKACRESYIAWRMANNGSVEKKYLNGISDIYWCRVAWAIALEKEYSGFARDDHSRTVADSALRDLADNNLQPLNVLFQTATERIEQIRANRSLATHGTGDRLIEAWNALHNGDKKLMSDADKQWKELCEVVDADPTRPPVGEFRY